MLGLIILPVLLIAGTILLTLLVEFPIIYYTHITRSKRYIVAVNALTNVCLNMGVVLFYVLYVLKNSDFVARHKVSIWTFFAEIVLIPFTETLLYLKLSKESAGKVFLITYLANFFSFLVGLIVVGLLEGRGFYGIRDFFATLFGRGIYQWPMY